MSICCSLLSRLSSSLKCHHAGFVCLRFSIERLLFSCSARSNTPTTFNSCHARAPCHLCRHPCLIFSSLHFTTSKLCRVHSASSRKPSTPQPVMKGTVRTHLKGDEALACALFVLKSTSCMHSLLTHQASLNSVRRRVFQRRCPGRRRCLHSRRAWHSIRAFLLRRSLRHSRS